MIDKIRFLIPNLDRRPDRWEFMQKTLVERGVPPELIERFPATDGFDYLDADENHMNFDLLKEAISDASDGKIPPFIAYDCSGTLTHLAWKWTWYAGLESIARNDDIVCWIIDDFVLDINYEQLLDYTNRLAETAKREWMPFLGIQLCRRPRDDNYSGELVESCPEFQYGFSSSDDVAIVYSPQGAAWVLDFANQQARHDWTDPCMLATDIRNQRCEGFFGLSEGAGPTENGMTSLCREHSLVTTLSGENCSDLVISRHKIEKRNVGINRTAVNIYAAFPQISNFPTYDDADPKTAVLIRLFSDVERTEQMTNMVLWAMRSHILNSDMRIYKPTPIFHVEQSHYERSRHMFEAAGVPESNIIVYPSDLVTTNLKGNLMHYAASPFLDPQLERFDRVIVVDGDSFSLANADTGWVPLMDISFNKFPQDSIQILRSWEIWQPETDEYQCWYERGNLGKERWIELAAQYANTTPDRIMEIMYPPEGNDTPRPWHNGAYINIPMDWLKAHREFRDFIREVSGVMGDEEIAMAVWFMKHFVETGERLPETGFQNIVWSPPEPLTCLAWDLDVCWENYDGYVKHCLLHLYDFNNITLYGFNWAKAIGASQEEAEQFTIAIRESVARVWKTEPDSQDTRQGQDTFVQPVSSSEHIEAFSLHAADKTRQIAADIVAICNKVAEDNRGDRLQPGMIVQHSGNELMALYEIVDRVHDGRRIEGEVLQCGLFCGSSALMMAHAIRDDNSVDCPMIAIDSYTKDYRPLRQLFDDAYHEYRENVWEFRLHEHITFVMSDTVSYLKNFWHHPIRVAFIDSSHHYEPTLGELTHIAPHLQDGSWLVLHDYFSESTPGVRKALDEYLAGMDTSRHTYYRMDELLIIKWRIS